MTSRYQIIKSGGVFDLDTHTIVSPDKTNGEWMEYQAYLTAGGTLLPASTIGQDDLATSKLKRQSEIDSYAAGLRNALICGRSVGEMASWTIKLTEARAYIATADAAQAPTLAAIALVRGNPLADMAARVLTQAAIFLQKEAGIDGIRGKHSDAIEAMADVRDIIMYDWHSGW